jgi:hypothetical protein
LVAILVSATAFAGTLTPGKPKVESDHYEVPIFLNGAGDQVAALNFSLAYDPAVFQPVSISPGAAADAAGKLVTANLPEPGKYIVVMMGFNQTPVANGEVARIVLERVGTSPQGETKLTVSDPTLSTWEGVEVSAEGGAASVTMAPKDPAKPTDGNGTKPTVGKPEKPTTSAEGEAPSAKPQGSPRVTIAGQANGTEATATTPKDAPVSITAPATSGGKKAETETPDVAAVAARAAEERSRMGGVPTETRPVSETKTTLTATNQTGQPARTADIQTSRSLRIEDSGTVNNNTAGSAQPVGTQRESVVSSGGWMRLGLTAAVLLAVAGGAWLLRSRIFR